MKILHIIDSDGFYGAGVMLLNLMAEQTKCGLKPVIVSIGEKHIKEKPLETDALKRGLQVWKFKITPGPNLDGALEFLRYAKREGFDLLHSHGYKGKILFGSIPRTIRQLSIVLTLHRIHQHQRVHPNTIKTA